MMRLIQLMVVIVMLMANIIRATAINYTIYLTTSNGFTWVQSAEDFIFTCRFIMASSSIHHLRLATSKGGL